MEQSARKSYRNIVSSTVVFGGAQVMNMLINLVRGKIVVQILGAAGIGISTLFHNAADLIQQYSLLGIHTASVRNVSQAHDEATSAVLSHTIRLVRRLILCSALFGLLSTLALSVVLTRYYFADDAYLPFVLLMSVAVLFNILAAGEYSLLQGMRRYKHIALCSTIPPFCGLLCGVPIYWFFGTAGIVPAMIVLSVVYYAATRMMTRRSVPTPDTSVRITWREMWQQGRGILQLGIVLTCAAILGTLTTFATAAYIKLTGSDADLGLYTSANAITLQYVTLVFNAMAANYYPQLAQAISKGMRQAHRLVNQEMEIVLLVMAPVSMLTILTAPLLILLLLRSDMLVIQTIVRYMGVALFLRGICFSVDYLSLSKGDKRYFFWVEGVWSNVKTLAVLCIFYSVYGLDGLGYGTLASALIDVVTCLSLNRWRFGFRPSRSSIVLGLRMLLFTATCFLCSFIPNPTWAYTLMTLLTLLCIFYSYRQLDRRIDIRQLWADRRQRRRSKKA